MKRKPSTYFVWRKIHSLTGIIPIGIFLCIHLFINSFSLKGEEAFEEAVGFLHKLPYLLVIEIGVIFIPILFHMIYGLYITYTSDPDIATNKRSSNYTYFLQRVTGIMLVIFLFAHVYGTTITVRYLSTEEVEFFQFMNLLLSNPGNMVFYLVGLAAAVFHFANGIWNFLITWGFTVGRESQRFAGWVCILIGLAIYAVGANALLGFLGSGITIFN